MARVRVGPASSAMHFEVGWDSRDIHECHARDVTATIKSKRGANEILSFAGVCSRRCLVNYSVSCFVSRDGYAEHRAFPYPTEKHRDLGRSGLHLGAPMNFHVLKKKIRSSLVTATCMACRDAVAREY